LTTALHGLAHEASARAEFRVDANGFAARFPLTPEQSRALVGLDVPAMVTMGVHPLVAFLANMQVQRERADKPS
jgi:2,3-dihydroxyphenylpropionate 1,2-dioxygenase